MKLFLWLFRREDWYKWVHSAGSQAYPVRVEREARHGTDPVSHEASSVVVFDGGPQLAFLTVHIYVLTHRAT